MKSYPTEKIRNIGLFGHQGSGKTSLAEGILFTAGVIDRLGRVEEGHTTTDYDPDEVKRQMTVFSALAPVEWKGHKINVIDTPGFFDFVAEGVGAMRAAEGAVLVAAANAGIEVGLEKFWNMAEDRSLPRLLFVNKMDKENANFERLLEEAAEKLQGARVVPLQLPIGAAETFTGMVSLVQQKAWTFDAKGQPQESTIPADMQDSVSTWREKLMEEAAEADDALTEKYLETMELSDEEIRDGLCRRIQAGTLVPAFCGSATHLKGISLLLDRVLEYIPSPAAIGEIVGTAPGTDKEVKRKVDSAAPISALVFKTSSDPYVGKISYLKVYSGIVKHDTVLHNANRGEDEKIGSLLVMRGKHQEKVDQAEAGDIVAVGRLGGTATGDTLCDGAHKIQLPKLNLPESFYSRSIHAKSKADEDKLSSNLQKLLQEDPTLRVKRLDETHETILSGVGDVQLDLCVERLKRLGVEVELSVPKVPYRETIRGKTQQMYRHKKQSGGRGQFGDCHIEIEPLEPGAGFVFEDRIKGGVIPSGFIPAVEKGVREAMTSGPVAGFPVKDVLVRLVDGSYHSVDSSEMAFKLAGSIAMREAMAQASGALLEPIMLVTLSVPEASVGDVIGDLNARRGRPQGMEPAVGMTEIKAEVPMAELLSYAPDLRSLTGGQGDYTMEFLRYEEVPAHLAERVVAASREAALA